MSEEQEDSRISSQEEEEQSQQEEGDTPSSDSECTEGENIFFRTKWSQKEPKGIIQHSDISENEVWLIRVPSGFDYSSLKSISLARPDQDRRIGTHTDGKKRYMVQEAPPIQTLSKVSIFPQNGQKFYWGKPFSRQLDILQEVVVETPKDVKEQNTEKQKKEPKLSYKFVPAGAVVSPPCNTMTTTEVSVVQPVLEKKKSKKKTKDSSETNSINQPNTTIPPSQPEENNDPTTKPPSKKQSTKSKETSQSSSLNQMKQTQSDVTPNTKPKKRKKSKSITNQPASKKTKQ